MSWRRLGVLIEHIPDDSATARSLRGFSAWSTTEHLLASVIDLLAGANWQRSGGKGAKPKPLKRPGIDDGDVQRIGDGTTLPLDQARARLDRLHGRKPYPRTDDERRAVLVELDAAATHAERLKVRRRYRIPARSSAPSHWRRALGVPPAPRLARR